MHACPEAGPVSPRVGVPLSPHPARGALWLLYGAVAVFLQMTEMEISRAAAERSLREHMGNVVEALITLTN